MYKRLKELREGNGFNQYHICEYLNCTQQAYSAYELGKRDIPTKDLIMLSKHYNVSVDYLLGVSNQPKIQK